MTSLCFVSSRRGNHFMTEILDALVGSLVAEGIAAEHVLDEFPDRDADTAYVVIPHEFFAVNPTERWPRRGQLRRTVGLCVEMPGTPWFERSVGFAQHVGATMAISGGATAQLKLRGVKAEMLQLGYTPAWDVWHGSDDAPRPHDVVYMGSNDERRDRFLASYAHTLWRRDTHILLPTQSPRTEAKADFVMGDAKYELLRDSKVLLNLHRADSRCLEWVRVLEAMSNGCVVVSEHSIDHSPLVPGEHFVSAAPNDLALVADHLLHEPEALHALRLQAYHFVREHLPIRDGALRLADIASSLTVTAARTAATEPTSTEPSHHYIPWEPAHPDDFVPPVPDRLDTEFQRTRRGLYRVAVENLQTRRLLQALIEQLSGEQWDPDGLRIAAATPTYADAAPRVSVLMPVYNHEREVLKALASVASQRYGQLEVLMCDDASTDRSIDSVKGFLDEHPFLPAMLWQARTNKGPSRARNALVARARGEFVFFLDSDNGIFPTMIERLVATLDADPGASFAYAMEAVHTGGEPVELVSCRPWEPAELRRGNFLDVMSLIRREAFLGIGGFCEDIRLTHWEDYDLWCRFAEAGHRGVLRPEILATYRRSLHSRDGFGQVDNTAVLSFIKERSPTLFAGSGPSRAAL